MLVHGEGRAPCDVMLVSEKPGYDEIKTGRPFTGQAGRLLNWFLDEAGLSRKDMFITNVLRQLPKSQNKIEQWEIDRDTPYLLREIERVRPKFIFAAGATAIRWFYGPGFDVSVHHGFKIGEDVLRLMPKNFRAEILPGLHPAHALHEPDLIPQIQEDFNKFATWMSKGIVPKVSDPFAGREMYRLLTDKDEWMVDSVLRRPEIAVDTEGTAKDPICLSFSEKAGEGWVVWFDEHSQKLLDKLRRIFTRKKLILHNSMWDLDVLRAVGIEGFDFEDTMVMSYNLCNLPQRLKALAYRLCGMTMEDYTDIVGPIERDLQIDWLIEQAKKKWPASEPILVPDEKRKGSLRIKKPQSLNNYLDRLLRDALNNEELDIKERWGNIDEAILDPLFKTVGNLPVATLRNVPRERAIYYAGRDADATIRLYSCHLSERIRKLQLDATFRMDMDVVPMANHMQSMGLPLNIRKAEELDEAFEGEQGRIRQRIKQLVGIRINPESPPDCSRLLFDQLRLTSLKKTKTGANSTNEKAIESLREAHPVVPLILDHRELNKMRTSFIQVFVRKAKDDPHSRVRCNLRVTRVASGRFSATDPNLLAVPVTSDRGIMMRHLFEAPDGYVFGSWDLEGAEMRVFAHESEEPELLKAFRDPNSPNVHLAAARDIFGVKIEDVTPTQKAGAKRVNFGVITGITGQGLLDQFRLYNIPGYSEDDCDEMISEWYKARPKAYRYLLWCRAQARRDGYIRCMWGRYRYLHGIWSPIPKLVAEAERQSHSHRIQSGAQGVLKMAMKQMWGYRDVLKETCDAEPVLQIHDEVLWLLREENVKEMDVLMKNLMTKTVKLKVPVKASGSWSKTWGGAK